MWPAPPSQDARKIDPPQGLEIDFLITYLLGKTVQLTESQYLELQGFGLGLAQKEPRIGIGLNTAQRTARQGLFYTARFARLKEDPRAVLVADLVGGDLSALQNRGEDVLLLGGESRLARFRVAEEYDWHVDKFIEALAGLDKFKLYALTPLPLGSAAGEVFDGLSGNGPYLGGRKIKVTAAATGRPVRISGFDVKNGRPRKSLLAWPPGSVFYIQLEDGPCDDEFVRRVHGQSLLRPGSWEEQIGLGQVLLGKLFEDSV
jgi:CRISPR-associated protein Cmr3